MAVIGAGAAELGFSALYDLLKSALSRLRRRRGWERGLADYCRQQGVSLSDAEIARLIEWIRAGDIDALATDAGGDLVTALDREVMRTSDPALAAQQASPSQWAAENRHRAEQLGAAIWGAVDAVLERDERVGLRAAVAAVHSSEVADSLMAELGWLRDEVERLPRLVIPDVALERARLRLPPDIPASPYHLLWPRSGVVPFEDRGGWLPELTAWVRLAGAGQRPDRAGSRRHGQDTPGARSLPSDVETWLASRVLQPRPRILGRGARSRDVPSAHRPRLRRDPPGTRARARRTPDRPDPIRDTRVRVLLLVRRLGRRRDPRRWFLGPSDRATQLIDAATVMSLSTESDDVSEAAGIGLDPDARHRLFRSAAAAFQSQLGTKRPVSDRDLAAPSYSSPLFILIAALLESSAEVGDFRRDTSEEELLDRIIEREQHSHWNDSPEPDVTLQQRCVAVATLLGADTEQEAGAHLDALEPGVGATTAQMALWLHRLYDGPRWLNPLEPDLLGEQLVAAHLRSDTIGYVVGLEPSPSTIQAYAVLARIAARRVDLRELISSAVADAMPDLLKLASNEAQRRVPNPATDLLTPVSTLVELLAIEPGTVEVPTLTRPSLAGNRLAAVLAEQAVTHARQHARSSPSRRTLADLAKALRRSADWLADIGDLAASVDRLTEEVEIRRQLPADTALRARSQLATALNNLGHRARTIGRLPLAVGAIEEAVAIRRALLSNDPESQDAELATVLTNLSNVLGAVGRHNEALDAADEVVRIRRRIHTHGDPPSDVALARALNNRAIHRRDQGAIAAAIEDLDDAIRRLRPIAELDTQRTEELAATLINKGLALTSLPDLDRLEEAIEITEEAVKLRRVLADAKPDVYDRQLADALTNLAVNLSRLARRTAGGQAEQLGDTVAYFPAPRGQSPGRATDISRSLLQLLVPRLVRLAARWRWQLAGMAAAGWEVLGNAGVYTSPGCARWRSGAARGATCCARSSGTSSTT